MLQTHEKTSSRPLSGPSPESPASGAVETLVAELSELRSRMRDSEASQAEALAALPQGSQASAANLLHCLTLRRHDVAGREARLARMGLASLEGATPHVMATLDAVLDVLHGLRGGADVAYAGASFAEGTKLRDERAAALLGRSPSTRRLTLMATADASLDGDRSALRTLLDAGLDVLRLDASRDGATVWRSVVEGLREAERRCGRRVPVVMDLAGPRPRTGPMDPGPQVLKLRPVRDARGRVLRPAKVWLVAEGVVAPPGEPSVEVPDAWIRWVQAGDTIRVTDARGAERKLQVVRHEGGARLAVTTKTLYLDPGATLRVRKRAKKEAGFAATAPGGIPHRPEALRIRIGEELLVARGDGLGQGARHDAGGALVAPATLCCPVPALFESLIRGARVAIDGGRIEATVVEVEHAELRLLVSGTPRGGAKLRSRMDVEALDASLPPGAFSAGDLEALDAAAVVADGVALAASCPADLEILQEELARRGASHVGILLKVDAPKGVEALPGLILALLRSRTAGILLDERRLSTLRGVDVSRLRSEVATLAAAAHLPLVRVARFRERLSPVGRDFRPDTALLDPSAEALLLPDELPALEALRAFDDGTTPPWRSTI